MQLLIAQVLCVGSGRLVAHCTRACKGDRRVHDSLLSGLICLALCTCEYCFLVVSVTFLNALNELYRRVLLRFF